MYDLIEKLENYLFMTDCYLEAYVNIFRIIPGFMI